MTDYARSVMYLCAAILCGSLMSTTTLLFWCNRRFLKQLGVPLIVIGGVTSTVQVVTYLTMPVFDNSPCFYKLWISYLCYTSWITSLGLRAWRVIFLVRLNEAKLAERGRPDSPSHFIPLAGTSETSVEMVQPGLGKPASRAEIKRRKTDQWYLDNKMRATDEWPLRIFAYTIGAVIVYCFIAQCTSPIWAISPARYRCVNALSDWSLYPLMLFITMYILVFAPYTACRLARSGKDAHGIRREVLIVGGTSLICFPLYGIFIQTDFPFEKYWKEENWVALLAIISHIVSVVHPLLVLRRTVKRKGRYGDVEASDSQALPTREGFDVVIAGKESFADFTKYAASDFCAENTRFVYDYQDLKLKVLCAIAASSDANSPELIDVDWTRKSQAVAKSFMTQPKLSIGATVANTKLYRPDAAVTPKLHVYYRRFFESFLRSGSVLEVNLTSRELEMIYPRFENPATLPTLDVFDDAHKHILDLLFFDTYVKYVYSQN